MFYNNKSDNIRYLSFMVNAHFECKHISQFKGLIDVFNYWSWEDKKWAKLIEEMMVQFKLEYYSVIGS
jgi:hypothetical protein